MRLLGTILYLAIFLIIYSIVYSFIPIWLTDIFLHIGGTLFCIYFGIWTIQILHDLFLISEVPVAHKAVLITGCDTGFGNILAKYLDKKGFKVFAGCLDPRCDGAIDLKENCSSKLTVIGLDVTDVASVQQALSTVKENLNGSEFWAVINNAGVLRGFIIELTRMEDFEACLQVNVLGAIRVVKAFLPLLRISKGRVVNICSVSGRFSSAYIAAYSMSKYAAIAFTEVLMQEAREFGIRVISIEPDVFRTPMTSALYLSNNVDSAIKDANERIREAYGEDYIQKAKDVYIRFFAMSSKRIDRIIKAVDNAVSLKYPADVYRPRGTIFTNLLFFFANGVPRKAIDLVAMIYFFIMKIPKTKAGLTLFQKFLRL